MEAEKLDNEIRAIKARNRRVEADKAWEISWFRKILIVFITYIIAMAVMFVIKVANPWLGALIPTLGYFLSTLTIPFAKKWWINRYSQHSQTD